MTSPAVQAAGIISGQMSGVSLIWDFGRGMGRGQTVGHYSQQDVVDGYARKMTEELENENVRMQTVPTRKGEGIPWGERLSAVPKTFVPVILTCDFHERDRVHNASVVEFSGVEYQKLAESLCFALSEWGRCYVWGHRVSRPVVVNGAPRSYICIKPFALNGPNADDYLQRLDALGESLGRAIGGFFAERNQGRLRAR